MTNKEIVDTNYNLIMQCLDCQFAKIKDKRYKEDFTNDLFLTLLTYDNAKMNDAHNNNHFNALVSRIIINNLWSSTSPYYANYKRFEDRTIEIGEEDYADD